ncbi:MAG: hypothetical protein ABSG30_04770 [Steroidobacteraceae bacterium]|jgi:hypothetical protein
MPTGYFVTPYEYAEPQWLRALERRAYGIKKLSTGIADAIETGTMNPADDHLNDLLKEHFPAI